MSQTKVQHNFTHWKPQPESATIPDHIFIIFVFVFQNDLRHHERVACAGTDGNRCFWGAHHFPLQIGQLKIRHL